MAVGEVVDVENIYSALSVLKKWSYKNNMLFNSLKFECMKTKDEEGLKIDYNYLNIP